MQIFHLIFLATITFITTFYLTPKWIKKAWRGNIIGEDFNKKDRPKVAELGGLPVIGGFLVGVLMYVALMVFIYKDTNHLNNILVIISSLSIATIIGLVDDMLGWKIGLRIRYKITATILIALPVMVMNTGVSTMTIPFIGPINFGLIYPLLLIPIGIVGASNGFNMIAGFNGLETGLGIIILSTLTYFSFATGNSYLAIICLIMIASLLAFIFFNKYPAKVFPGNIFTYSVGALIAIIIILGNFEKFGVILFIPYFIELILKARGKMRKESFAKLNDEGNLERPYQKYYGLEHIAIDVVKKIKGRAREKEVVYLLLFFQITIAVIDIIYFKI